jgi:putative addiction module component (TIGR02574 family)
MTSLHSFFNEIASLQSGDKIKLVEMILESLHSSNTNIEESWKKEVEERIQEYENNSLKTISEKEVFSKYSSL